jgi:hypothetical protein
VEVVGSKYLRTPSAPHVPPYRAGAQLWQSKFIIVNQSARLISLLVADQFCSFAHLSQSPISSSRFADAAQPLDSEKEKKEKKKKESW